MKTLFITGGTGDLGSVVVARLKRDYRCVVSYRSTDSWERLRSSLDDANLIGLSTSGDLSGFAPLHGIVHLAGGFASGGSQDDFQRMLDMNLLAAVRLITAAIPHVSDGGRIIAISAAASITKPAGLAAYTASKAALNAYLETLAKELKSRRVTVNALLPTTIDEAMRTNIAETITFLLSESAAGISGQLIVMSS